VPQSGKQGESNVAILDVVEFLDPVGDVIAARVPEHSSGEFRLGSQCIVRDGQVALFCRDGRALDMLGPGRHTLTSANIPLLVDLLSLPFGGRSPFRADVYFINLQQLTDLRWGTSQPLPVRDAQLGVVRLRAFGSYIVQIDSPRAFYSALLGTRGRFVRADIEEQLRSILLTGLSDTLGEQMAARERSVFDLAASYQELAGLVSEKVAEEFEALGFRLLRFYINTISLPEEVERRVDQYSGVQMFGGLDGYSRFRAVEALGDAAQAGGDGAAGAGLGLGAGMHLGQLLGQNLQPPQPPTPPAASGAPASGGDMLAQLERLAQLRAQGMLSEAEFAAAKAKLLGI
jgi:membrane protease subunit (stomatin/prohibitin family)